MMIKKKCIAMLLAGGQGSRLGALTKNIAKPAVSFGGKYRIIDFSLSNCTNSGIDTVGVLTQYRPYVLNNYIGNGSAWDLDSEFGGASILPPYETEKGGEWYKGTADAIYQNINYIESFNPEHVLILSGDHLYRMDYRKMLKEHIDTESDLTISVMTVPWEDAPRFGTVNVDENSFIRGFAEKSPNPDSNIASMGLYIFKTSVLIDALKRDAVNENSSHDFGKDVIPMLLNEGRRLYAYNFEGFWKDVGTIPSYYETAMGLLDPEPEFNLFCKEKPIYGRENMAPPHFVGPNGSINYSIVANGSVILGKVEHSIISTDAYVGEGAEVVDSILLPGASVKAGAKVNRAILGEDSVIEEGVCFGSADPEAEIAVIGDKFVVERGE